MALIGVITGDIVDSTKIEGDGRTKLLNQIVVGLEVIVIAVFGRWSSLK